MLPIRHSCFHVCRRGWRYEVPTNVAITMCVRAQHDAAPANTAAAAPDRIACLAFSWSHIVSLGRTTTDSGRVLCAVSRVLTHMMLN